MGHTLLCVLRLLSLNTLLHCGRAADAILTHKPGWSSLCTGESVTFSCDTREGNDSDWTYSFSRNGQQLGTCTAHKSCTVKLTKNSSGEYRCSGHHLSTNVTAESNLVTLNVSDNTKPVLVVSPFWLSHGDSVTLNCSVKDPTAGWRFYWYKAVPSLSSNYSYEMLPGSSRGSEEASHVVHGQTNTAGYVCRAGRGDPVFYTYYSKPKFVFSAGVHPASIKVSPDRVQHFSSESVSVSCEGNSGWRARRFSATGHLSDCSDWGTKLGSTCTIHRLTNNTAVYWCETGSGQFSNAVNITVQNKNIMLVSPVRPVTEGASLNLVCKFRTDNLTSTVLFYRNNGLIQNDIMRELKVPAVSKSDEGFYKCEYAGNVSPQSWLAVRSSRPETSSFHVPAIAGLVCGLLLVILLLLLCRRRRSKDLNFVRVTKSQKANQGFTPDEVVNQNKTPPEAHSSLLHDESSNVVYSLIQFKNVRNKGRHKEPEEKSVYSIVKVGSADV